MSSPRIAYASHFDTTPRVLARVAALRFVLDCYAEREAAPERRPNDAERSLSDGAREIIQDTK